MKRIDDIKMAQNEPVTQRLHNFNLFFFPYIIMLLNDETLH
jgi:hypothetical protein